MAQDQEQNKLSPEDLNEFRLRHTTFDQARCHFLMVRESYQTFVKEIGERYGIIGEFDINADGTLKVTSGDNTDGGSNDKT